MRGKRLVIREDFSAEEFRQRARREPDRAAAVRMVAICTLFSRRTNWAICWTCSNIETNLWNGRH